jgi:hypothetical protein
MYKMAAGTRRRFFPRRSRVFLSGEKKSNVDRKSAGIIEDLGLETKAERLRLVAPEIVRELRTTGQTFRQSGMKLLIIRPRSRQTPLGN